MSDQKPAKVLTRDRQAAREDHNSPEHTHTFTRPSLSESTLTSNRFLAARALSTASPRISACTFCFGLTLHSAHLLNQSPSLSPSPFQRNEPPSSLGLRPSQVSQSLRSHDCSLQFRNCHTATHSRHQPGCVFWGSMFHSSSHKFQNLHRDSTPCGYSLASPLDAPLPGAITGLSYPPICPFKQYRQVQISPSWPTVSQRCRHPPASSRPAVSQLAVSRIRPAAYRP